MVGVLVCGTEVATMLQVKQSLVASYLCFYSLNESVAYHHKLVQVSSSLPLAFGTLLIKRIEACRLWPSLRSLLLLLPLIAVIVVTSPGFDSLHFISLTSTSLSKSLPRRVYTIYPLRLSPLSKCPKVHPHPKKHPITSFRNQPLSFIS